MPCADPESFDRGGPTLTTFFFVDEGISGAIIGFPAKCHLNAGYVPKLNTGLVAFVIFKDLD